MACSSTNIAPSLTQPAQSFSNASPEATLRLTTGYNTRDYKIYAASNDVAELMKLKNQSSSYLSEYFSSQTLSYRQRLCSIFRSKKNTDELRPIKLSLETIISSSNMKPFHTYLESLESHIAQHESITNDLEQLSLLLCHYSAQTIFPSIMSNRATRCLFLEIF